MDIGSIFLILSMIVIVGVVLARPFQTSPKTDTPEGRMQDNQHPEHSALMASRDQVLDTLQELDFDHALGKIPEAHYQTQRAELTRQGAQILRQLDEVSPDAPQDVEKHLEAVVASLRADGRPQVARPEDEALENLVSARRRARQSKSAGFCPKCGKPAQTTDQFCSRCGGNLERTA